MRVSPKTKCWKFPSVVTGVEQLSVWRFASDILFDWIALKSPSVITGVEQHSVWGFAPDTLSDWIVPELSGADINSTKAFETSSGISAEGSGEIHCSLEGPEKPLSLFSLTLRETERGSGVVSNCFLPKGGGLRDCKDGGVRGKRGAESLG